MAEFSQSAPFAFLVLGTLAFVFVIVSYNVRTYKMMKRIESLARGRYGEGKIWGDVEKMEMFVYRPEEIVNSRMGGEILEVSQALLAHRRSLLKEVVKANAYFVAGGIAFAVAKFLVG